MAAQSLQVQGHYNKVVMKQQTVTTTSAQLTQLAASDAIKGTPSNIFLQALSTNSTNVITVYNVNPSVAGGAGIELVAGANINLPTLNPTEWYVVSSAGSPKLNITYMAGNS